MMDTPVSLLDRLRRPLAHDAWARFAELYTPLIYSWARRAGLPAQDAADLVQDVFLLLLQKLPEFTYDRHRSFRAWLRTVTLNKWREKRRRPTPPLAGPGEANLDEVPDADRAADVWEAEYRARLAEHAL